LSITYVPRKIRAKVRLSGFFFQGFWQYFLSHFEQEKSGFFGGVKPQKINYLE